MLEKTHQAPKTAKSFQSLPPKRQSNQAARSREYLATHEIEVLRKAARNRGRYGHRDDTLILVMFRHALRVSEAIALRWDQVDLKQGFLHVRRIKNGLPSTQPLRGTELRALRQLQRHYPHTSYVFVSERKAPLRPHIKIRAMKLHFDDKVCTPMI